MSLGMIAKLGLDGRSFATGLRQSESLARQSARKISGEFTAAAASLKSSFAAALGVGSLGMMMEQTIRYASEVHDLSAMLSVSKTRLQELDFAARLNSATLEDMVRVLRKVAQARSEALQKPGGEKARAFAFFGITPETLAGLQDPSELLLLLSDAAKGAAYDLNSLPIILELLGNKAGVVLPAMQEGLRRLGKEAHDSGAIMGDDLVDSLEAAGDSLDKLKASGRGFWGELALIFVNAAHVLLGAAKIIGNSFWIGLTGIAWVAAKTNEILEKVQSKRPIYFRGMLGSSSQLGDVIMSLKKDNRNAWAEMMAALNPAPRAAAGAGAAASVEDLMETLGGEKAQTALNQRARAIAQLDERRRKFALEQLPAQARLLELEKQRAALAEKLNLPNVRDEGVLALEEDLLETDRELWRLQKEAADERLALAERVAKKEADLADKKLTADERSLALLEEKAALENWLRFNVGLDEEESLRRRERLAEVGLELQRLEAGAPAAAAAVFPWQSDALARIGGFHQADQGVTPVLNKIESHTAETARNTRPGLAPAWP
jgi:hypothetical protein